MTAHIQQMTADQRSALHRLHRRATFMNSEAAAFLWMSAEQTGSPEARRRAKDVVTALRELLAYTGEQMAAVSEQEAK